MMEIYVTEFVTGRATLSGFIVPPKPGEHVKVVRRGERQEYDARVRSIANVPNNPRGHHWEIEYEVIYQGHEPTEIVQDEFARMIRVAEDAERSIFGRNPNLYSNCVILEFQRPITRAQLAEIDRRLKLNQGAEVGLPALRSNPICGEREGNSVVPTIAADEC